MIYCVLERDTIFAPYTWIRNQSSNVTVELWINNTGSRVNDPPSWLHIVVKWPILTVYTVDPKQNAYIDILHIHDGVPVSSLLLAGAGIGATGRTWGATAWRVGWLVGWLVHAAVHSPPLVTEIVPAHSRSHYKYNQHRPTSAWLWKQLNTFQEQLIHGMCFLLFMAGMYLRTVHVVYCMCIRLYGRVFAYSCTHRIVYMTWHLMFFASKQLYDTIETR